MIAQNSFVLHWLFPLRGQMVPNHASIMCPQLNRAIDPLIVKVMGSSFLLICHKSIYLYGYVFFFTSNKGKVSKHSTWAVQCQFCPFHLFLCSNTNKGQHPSHISAHLPWCDSYWNVFGRHVPCQTVKALNKEPNYLSRIDVMSLMYINLSGFLVLSLLSVIVWFFTTVVIAG